jgi:hypothetical protein
MAAGTKVTSSGQLKYAGGGITGGTAYGLLDVFTDVNGATPSAGNVMSVQGTAGVYSFGYNVGGGTYRGDYYINRNDSVGETIWGNINSNGIFRMDYYYNYIHWPTDNKFVTVWDNNNNPQDSMTFQVLCAGNKVLQDTVNAGSVYDPSSGVPYLMASGGGSSGAFTPATPNTDWVVQVNLYNVDQNQPTVVNYNITDYNNGNIYTSGKLLLDPSTGWSDGFSWTQAYPSIMVISLQSV